MSTILVTGATGTLGRALMELLAVSPDMAVRAATRPRSPSTGPHPIGFEDLAEQCRVSRGAVGQQGRAARCMFLLHERLFLEMTRVNKFLQFHAVPTQ